VRKSESEKYNLNGENMEIIDEIYSYSRIFAAVGLTIVGIYSALKYMKADNQLAKKDAVETFLYSLIGTLIVLLAPLISEVLVS